MLTMNVYGPSSSSPEHSSDLPQGRVLRGQPDGDEDGRASGPVETGGTRMTEALEELVAVVMQEARDGAPSPAAGDIAARAARQEYLDEAGQVLGDIAVMRRRALTDESGD